MTRAAIQSSDAVHADAGLPRYVDAKRFREALCLSDRAFRRGMAAGRIPRPDLVWGRSLRWRVKTVRAFLEELEANQKPKRIRERT